MLGVAILSSAVGGQFLLNSLSWVRGYCVLHSCSLLFIQVGRSIPHSLPERRLTKSLLSGSESLLSKMSESFGGSCVEAPCSKPYVMCSAMDAASAAINFLKGHIEEGVVDSPPTRGVLRTPLCSPSPLKRGQSTVSDVGLCSQSPRNQISSSKKLYAIVGEDSEHLRVNSGIPLNPALAPVTVSNINMDTKLDLRHRKIQQKSYSAGEVPSVWDVGSPLEQSISGGSTQTFGGSYKRRILGGTFSFGNRQASRSNVIRLGLT